MTVERIALQRSYARITPDEIAVKPARATLVGPLIQLVLTALAVWVIVTYINSLSLWLLMIIFVSVLISGPTAVLGLVYNVMGSAFVMERKKRTCRFQQGFLGLGLGTRELVPFERIARIEVGGDFETELGSGDLQDVVHWEVRLIKDNGRVLPFAAISAARPLADEALERANIVARATAEMCGSPVAEGRLPEWAVMEHRPAQYGVIEAPSVLGLRPTGVEDAPARLIELGLAERLEARLAGRVEIPPHSDVRDPATQVLNAEAIATWTPRLADAVEVVIAAGDVPLILGGDCSILLGPLLALRRRGRFGLLFIDGHADFYQPEAEPNGEAASMELAFATGHGPALLADIEGLGPLVRPEDVVVFGTRDATEQKQAGSQALPTSIRAFDLDAVRGLGPEAAARAAVDHLTRDGIEGFLVHIDADCLDDAVMPAVDYRLPGGLSTDELAAVLRIAVASGRMVGAVLTVYNPRLDEDGTAGQRLVDAMVAGLE